VQARESYEIAIGDVSLAEEVVGLSVEVRHVVPRGALVEDVDCIHQGSGSARAGGSEWLRGRNAYLFVVGISMHSRLTTV
jgi:hypothetical protein